MLTVQLYCEMLPPAALLEAPFRGPSPILADVRSVMEDAAGREVRLELVLRVTMTGEPGSPLVGDGLVVSHALLAEPEAFGLDAVRIWPQLTAEEGVWLSAATVDPYFERLVPLVTEAFIADGPGAPALLYDLEPPSDVLGALLGRNGKAAAVGRAAGLARRMAGTARDARVDDAAIRMADHLDALRAFDEAAAPGSSAVWQPRHTAAVAPIGSGLLRHRAEQALMTPTRDPRADTPLFDGLEAMCYGSLIAYLLGRRLPTLTRGAGDALVAATARSHRRFCRQQGVACGVLLGCTGVGLLGNEPVYQRPAELAGAARAAGVTSLERVGVYNLRGLLFDDGDDLRDDWQAWARAVTGA